MDVCRILLVEDDERYARATMAHLARYGKEREMTVRATWLKSAFDLSRQAGKHDLVILDIGLPGVSGMDAALLMRTYDKVTPIIFVTSLAQYALRGYEVGALDFVLKPVGYHDLALRLDRAMEHVSERRAQTVVISSTEGVRVVPLSSIDYVEVIDHDLIYQLANNERLRTRGSLSSVEQGDMGEVMLRVSKSHAVNMSRIDLLRGSLIRTLSGNELRISRFYKRRSVERITAYLGGRA